MTKLLIKLACRNSKDERKSMSLLSGIFGIICNTILCLFKFAVGSISGSVSITADAVNSLSDAGSGIVTIASSKLSNKPIDEEHPFGHGRIEYISALIISFLIFIMSFELAKSSVEKIISPSEVKFSIWYIVVLSAAIITKLYMALLNHRLYKETQNINLKAVKQDSLNDCIATASTIVALLISTFTSFKLADGIIGLIVAIVIFISGINVLKDITGKLLGQAPDEELVKSIEEIMLSEDMIVGVHDLIVHDYGPNRIIASAHAEVPSDGDILEIHDIIDNVEKTISEKLKIIICIHMDPIVLNDEELDSYKALTDEILKKLDERYTFHDFRMVKGPSHTNLIFDLVVPHKTGKTSQEIIKSVKKEFKKKDEKINLIITVEHSFT